MEGRHLIITGRVQGVGYRYNMVREATRLGATGWVRNWQDGSVEAEIFGSPEVIAALLFWARQGPPGSAVNHVTVSYREGECTDFVQQTTQ
jgi:acylphosphatase